MSFLDGLLASCIGKKIVAFHEASELIRVELEGENDIVFKATSDYGDDYAEIEIIDDKYDLSLKERFALKFLTEEEYAAEQKRNLDRQKKREEDRKRRQYEDLKKQFENP